MAFRKLGAFVFDNAGPVSAVTLALGIAVYFPTKVSDASRPLLMCKACRALDPMLGTFLPEKISARPVPMLNALYPLYTYPLITQAVMAFNSLRLEHEEMKTHMADLRKGQDRIQVMAARQGRAAILRLIAPGPGGLTGRQEIEINTSNTLGVPTRRCVFTGTEMRKRYYPAGGPYFLWSPSTRQQDGIASFRSAMKQQAASSVRVRDTAKAAGI